MPTAFYEGPGPLIEISELRYYLRLPVTIAEPELYQLVLRDQ